MTDTPELATALAAFQAEMPTVKKTKTADAGTYKYKYADLADVTEDAMPLLAKHGLSFTCEPDILSTGANVLRGVLLHKSGQERRGLLPLVGGTPQALGSSITYMRRYLLGCLTGIVTDEDDDGRGAQQRPQRAALADAFPKAATARPEAATDTPERMTPPTRRLLFALLHEKAIPDGQQLRNMNEFLGTSYASRADLSEVEANRVIDYLRTLPEPAGA